MAMGSARRAAVFAAVWAALLSAAAAHVCVSYPQQRGVFPTADYQATPPVKSDLCKYNQGVTGAAWIANGTAGGVCGVPPGAPTYSAGPVSATLRAGQALTVLYQENAWHGNCAPDGFTISFASVANPTAESQFTTLATAAGLASAAGNLQTSVTLPNDVTCNSCVLRVVYHTASTGTGVCATTAPAYYQCSDIKIESAGLSGGSIAGIIIAILLLGALAFGLFYCRRRICPEMFDKQSSSSSTTSSSTDRRSRDNNSSSSPLSRIRESASGLTTSLKGKAAFAAVKNML